MVGPYPKGCGKRKLRSSGGFCGLSELIATKPTMNWIKKNILVILLISLLGFLAVPKTSLAAWWNPFTWKIINKVTEMRTQKSAPVNPTPQSTDNQSSEIEKLKKEIGELKQKSLSDTKSKPLKIQETTPAPTQILKQNETWSSLENKYFTEANQNGWTTLIITNPIGEKRYYKKEVGYWIQKNSETEIQQLYLTPEQLTKIKQINEMLDQLQNKQQVADEQRKKQLECLTEPTSPELLILNF